MLFRSQEESLEQLKRLASANRQSVLIEGPKGSGKSYLARQYSSMVQVDDFAVVAPKVNDIRDTINTCIANGTSIMLCIENLDLGVLASSYALLKFLEEPIEGVYIVVTCRNLNLIPDTIISRSAVVTTQSPRPDDLELYARNKNGSKYDLIKNRLVVKCCNSFADIEDVLDMTNAQLDFYDSLKDTCKFKDNVSTVVWNISHYDSNTACNVELAIRCIMEIMNTPFITKCGIDCLRDLSKSRIASHAILSKFIFNAKYCE